MTMQWESFTMLYYKLTALNSPIYLKMRTKTNPVQNAHRWLRHIEAPWSLLKKLWVETMLKNKSVKKKTCELSNQCLSRHLLTFPRSSAVARSRFLAGVAITNISKQLALPYNEPDYLTWNLTKPT